MSTSARVRPAAAPAWDRMESHAGGRPRRRITWAAVHVRPSSDEKCTATLSKSASLFSGKRRSSVVGRVVGMRRTGGGHFASTAASHARVRAGQGDRAAPSRAVIAKRDGGKRQFPATPIPRSQSSIGRVEPRG